MTVSNELKCLGACCCFVVLSPAIGFGVGALWGVLSGTPVVLSGKFFMINGLVATILRTITGQVAHQFTPFEAKLLTGTVTGLIAIASVAAGVYFGVFGPVGIAIFGGIGLIGTLYQFGRSDQSIMNERLGLPA